MDLYRDLKDLAKDKAQLPGSLTEKELESRGLAVGRGAECSTRRALLKRLVLGFIIGIVLLAFLVYGLLQRPQISYDNQKIIGGELVTNTTSTPLTDGDDVPKWTFASYSDHSCQNRVGKSNGTAPRNCTGMGSDDVVNIDFSGDDTYTVCLYTKDSCKTYVGMYPGWRFKCRPAYYAASYRIIYKGICPGNREPCDPDECRARGEGCKCDPFGTICRCI